MNQHELPANAFINTSGSNRESVEKVLSRALHRVLSVVSSSETRSTLPGEITIPTQDIPEESIGDDKLMSQLETILLSSVHPSHSGRVPHMDPSPATASLIGDFAANGLAQSICNRANNSNYKSKY